MGVYDHKQSILMINGREITDFNKTGDAINIVEADLGDLTTGTSGKGIFVASDDETGVLTLKLLQHSADNQYLNNLKNQQKTAIKSFSPIEMYFKDTLNGDEYIGHRGYFTTPPPMSRGTDHNETTWVIKFEQIKSNLKAGLHN